MMKQYIARIFVVSTLIVSAYSGGNTENCNNINEIYKIHAGDFVSNINSIHENCLLQLDNIDKNKQNLTPEELKNKLDEIKISCQQKFDEILSISSAQLAKELNVEEEEISNLAYGKFSVNSDSYPLVCVKSRLKEFGVLIKKNSDLICDVVKMIMG